LVTISSGSLSLRSSGVATWKTPVHPSMGALKLSGSLRSALKIWSFSDAPGRLVRKLVSFLCSVQDSRIKNSRWWNSIINLWKSNWHNKKNFKKINRLNQKTAFQYGLFLFSFNNFLKILFEVIPIKWLTSVRSNGSSDIVTTIKEPLDQPWSYKPCTTCNAYWTFISFHLSVSTLCMCRSLSVIYKKHQNSTFLQMMSPLPRELRFSFVRKTYVTLSVAHKYHDSRHHTLTFLGQNTTNHTHIFDLSWTTNIHLM